MQVLRIVLLAFLVSLLRPPSLEAADDVDKLLRECSAAKKKACARLTELVTTARLNQSGILAVVGVLTDPVQLVQVVDRWSGDEKIIEASLKRVTDQRVLATLARTHQAWLVRVYAVKRVSDGTVLADIAKNEKNDSVRGQAVENLSDQSLLADIVKTDQTWTVRVDAVRRLQNPSLIGDVARTDTNERVRELAAEALVASDKFDAVPVMVELSRAKWNDRGDTVERLLNRAVALLELAATESPAATEAAAAVSEPFLRENPQLLLTAINQKRVEAVRYLLTRGADPNAAGPNRYGSKSTPLEAAISGQQIQIVQELLARGADPKASAGGPLLNDAAWLGDVPIVELLLSKGVDVNAVDRDGETALIAAVRGRKVDVVKALLAKGATVQTAGPRGTAAQMAAGRGYAEIAQALKERGASDPAVVAEGKIVNARVRMVREDLGRAGQRQTSFFDFDVETPRGTYPFSLDVDKAKGFGVYQAPITQSGTVQAPSPYMAVLTLTVGRGPEGQFTFIPQGKDAAILVKFTPKP